MATLTLEEFLPKARQLNPDYTDDEHIAAYEQRYGRRIPVQTVSAAPLTTFDEFLPKARALNPDYSDEEHRAFWREKYGARGAKEKDQGDFVRGGVTAFKQIPQTIRGLEAGAGAIGEKIAGSGGLFTALKEHGLKGYQEHAADIAKDSKPSDSVSDAYKMAKAGDPGALVDWLQYALGYGGGQALQMLATAGIGYAGGKLALQPAAKAVAEKMIAKESARLAATGIAGEQLAKQAVSNVAGKIGQIGALGATAVGMEGGEIYGGLVEKAAEEGRSLTGAELAKAAGATLGAGVLEFVGDKIGLDLVLGKSVAGKLVKSRLGHAGAAGTLGVATEGGTEFTQTLIEEFGKGNDPFSPESLKQAIDAAALGGVGGGAVGTAGGLLRRPQGQDDELKVTDRTPPDRLALPAPPIYGEGPVYTPTGPVEEVIPGKGRVAGLGPSGNIETVQGEVMPDMGLRRIGQAPQEGELRGGTVYGGGPTASPIVDVGPILAANDLDTSIAQAAGVLKGPSQEAMSRAAEFARMMGAARDRTDQLIANAPVRRESHPIPILPGPESTQAGLLDQPSIVPGQAFRPRQEPPIDPRQALAEERARMVAERNARPPVVPEPVPVNPEVNNAPGTPLQSAKQVAIEKAYPSVQALHELAGEKGFNIDTPVFREYTKQVTGKQHLDDLTPQERERFASVFGKVPSQPAATPTEAPAVSKPRVEKPYESTVLLPEAKSNAPIQSDITPDLTANEAAPSPKEVRSLIHEKGLHLDTPTFKEHLEKVTGKTTFSDLEPAELKTLKDSMNGIASGETGNQQSSFDADASFRKEAEKLKAKPAPKETPSTQEFELTEPQSRLTGKGTNDNPNAEQLSIEVPPPTVGERPIIGREATQAEAPLFSKNAQAPDAEQTAIEDAPVTQKDRRSFSVDRVDPTTGEPRTDTLKLSESVRKAENAPPGGFTEEDRVAPSSPTDILASALRSAADQIEGKRSIQDVGEKVGGARKDLVGQSGPKAAKPKSEGPAWMRRYTVSQIVSSSRASENGKWAIRDTKDTDFAGRPRQIGSLFETEDEARSMIPVVVVAKTHRVYKNREGKWEIFKLASNNKLLNAVNQQFDTEKDAKRYLAQNAADILEAKTFFGEEVLPRPETVERIGTDRRNGRNVEANDFKNAFGFRSIEFGNWQNQDERQDVMNHAFDGLHDLADTLNIPPRAIGLNGDLALAFGSRGHGLSGAAAHYERNYGVINLTKMQGAGHLAHEWFHAADHYFGRQDTKASSEKEKNERGDLVFKAKSREDDYASHGFRRTGSQVRQEVRDAYNALITTMFRKGEQFVEDAKKADEFVAQARQRVAEQLAGIRDTQYGALTKKREYGKRNNDPASAEQLAEFDAIANRILEGELFADRWVASDMANKSQRYAMSGRSTNDALEKISAIYKAVRGRSGFGTGDQRGILDDLRASMQFYSARLKMLADAQAGTEKTKQVPTSFAMEAKSMDQGRKEAYWATNHEMAARAFAAYVEDKLKAEGKKSDFITYHTKGAVPTIWGWKKPYPEGTEREAINQAFDKFVGVLQTKETDQGVALYDERDGAGVEPSMEQFEAGINNGVPIGNTQFRLIDSSQQFPRPLMKQTAMRAYVRKVSDAIESIMQEVVPVLQRADATFGNPEFIGLSPDDYYLGVNLRGVNDQVIMNPWGALWTVQKYIRDGKIAEGQTQEYTASVMLDTLIHELTHQQVTTTHKPGDPATPIFAKMLRLNHAILGADRLDRIQRQLMAVLTGGPDGSLAHLAKDLNAQLQFWKGGNELSDKAGARAPEPTRSFHRRDVAGRGEEGRARPPTYLRGSSERETSPLDESSRLQRSRTDDVTGTIDPPTAKARLSSAKPSLRPYLLGALGLEQISQVYGKDHAEVRQYNHATQAMEADFVEMSRGSEQIVKSWTALKIPVADAMAKVMEEARFLNFDPDPQSKQDADSQKKKDLRKRFEALPGDAQSTYQLARDFYTDMAEKRFQALKERIERAGGTPENTKKLVDRLQLAYEQVRSKVYFPFTRFGENIVVAKQMKDGKEIDREVHAFESTADAQQFATHMKMKGWTVKQTVAKQYSLDKEGPASKIVRQMHDIIKELDEQPGLPGVSNLTDQLLDSLNQSFLQALPDMSYAKHFIHAKDVKGASKDALRAFAHSALHGAHHISRIKHADLLTAALSRLDERVNETSEGDVTEARQVYNELIQRHNEILNPSTHPMAAWLGQLGFTMSLGGVVATGVTNATQVPLITFPWLGARFGFGKASAALARAYKDFLDPRTLNKDSLFDATKSKLISESERKMLLELARRGRIDLTQTMDLAGLSAQDNLSRRARLTGTLNEKVTKMLGFTFHAPEVMNRQVTALSTFRLEKERGGSFDEALQRAEQAIIDTHFIYTQDNRPRYMSGNVLRVLTMFKQYSANIAFMYGRAASIAMSKGDFTKDERTVAKRQLISMLALQFGAAGALGMPFFGAGVDALMAVVGAFGDDDDKRDWEVALRKWLDGSATSLAEAFMDDKEQAREVGKELAEVVSHGLSRLTPWDMASRLGQSDLFFREPQREREGRQAVMDWMLALGGPAPSYGVNFLLGIGDVAKGVKELNAGFFLRGIEELTPAVLRNGVKSLRYAIEDVRTRDQYKQLELDTSETLGQAFGFTPSRVAEMYESTTAVKNKEHRVLNQRKALLERFSRSVTDQDDDAKERTIDAIRSFNEREPMFAITSNTLNRSLKSRAQHEAGMERGMYQPPRRRALLDEGDFGDF